MKTFIVIIIIILLALGGMYLYRKQNAKTIEYLTPTPQSTSVLYKDLIQIDSPLSGAVITSPVTVKGKARGNWYFEATFGVEVLDEDGTSLGAGPAQAHGEWMTAEYVPFSVSIPFKTPKGKIGKIVFHKDNPSGIPEREDSISIPVLFK